MNMDVSHKLILHIGQTKAGSTAIQNYLENERDVLLRHGFLFPKTILLRQNPFDRSRSPGHFGLISAIKNANLTEFENEIAAADFQYLIISIENLFIDQPDSIIREIGNYFSSAEIMVVAVLREVSDWSISRYIEEVLSGFRQNTFTFYEFFRNKIHNNSLYYADRLEHIARLLGAKDIRIVNYDSAVADCGLIAAFLEVAGIPITNPSLARSLRANVREKEFFLIEGKRRLNYFAGSLSRETRLEFEASIRCEALRLAAAMQDPPVIFSKDRLPLTLEECDQIEFSNLRLITDFGLMSPLASPKPEFYRDYQHRSEFLGLADLIAFGQKELAGLIRKDAKVAPSGETLTGVSFLGQPGCEAALDIIARARISIHLNSPDTALLSACYNMKLPIIVGDINRDDRSITQKILRIKLGSEVVIIDSENEIERLLLPFLKGSTNFIDAIFVSIGVDINRIYNCWRLASDGCAMVLMGYVPRSAIAIAEELGIVNVRTDGGVSIWMRPNTTAKEYEHAE